MKIYFTSGKVVEREMDYAETKAMVTRMGGSGIRFYDMRDGRWIPLNSNTIELIESENLIVQRKPVPVEMAAELTDREDPDATFEQEQLSAPVSREEKADNVMQDIINKSNCKHEQEKLILSTVGSKKGDRYFYVCSFCGWRGRFVKADSLTPEEIDNATEYKAS